MIGLVRLTGIGAMGNIVNSFLQHMHGASAIHALLFLAVGMVLESTLVPIPSELVLPVAGIWASQGKFLTGFPGLIEAMVIATVGSLAGSAISYAIGFYGGTPFVHRYGRYFLVRDSHLVSAEKWLCDHGMWAVSVGRVVFGVRHVQSIVAGTLRMPFGRFLMATAVGCGVWNAAGIYLGYRYGKAIEGMVRNASVVMLAVLVLAVALVVAMSLRRSKTGEAPLESRREQ